MALSVREYPNPEPMFWGTLLEPRPLELNFSESLTSSGPDDGGRGWPFATTVVRTTLGFEAMPSSDFWLFKLERETFLRVERITDDPYGVHVAVALVDGITNRRVVSLVHSQDGVGPEVLLQKGTYKLVAALGLPEVLCKIELRLHATTKRIRMQGLAVGRGMPELAWRVQFLHGLAFGSGRGRLFELRRRALFGRAWGTGQSVARSGVTRLGGLTWGHAGGVAHLAFPISALATGVSGAGAQMRLGLWRLKGLAWGSGQAAWISKREQVKMKGTASGTGQGILLKRTSLSEAVDRQFERQAVSMRGVATGGSASPRANSYPPGS